MSLLPQRARLTSQTLGAQYLHIIGYMERIRYMPGILASGCMPSWIYHEVRWPEIASSLQRLEAVVNRLVGRAIEGEGRGKYDVGDELSTLSRLLFPKGQFGTLVEPGADVVFDPLDEWLSSIPWEMLTEAYRRCPKNPAHVQFESDIQADDQSYCVRDGTEMCRISQRLGIGRKLSFTVLPAMPPLPDDGKEFLAIIDPREDLLSGEGDPKGTCTAMHRELVELLRGRFLARLTLLQGRGARMENVKRCLARPDLAGVYYFGHGHVPDDGGQGWLELADGELYVSSLREMRAVPRLVFLNACKGAHAPLDWKLGAKFGSIAHAFAQGPLRSVIGSIWPLISTQAAEAALLFFKSFVTDGATVGDALCAVRQKSLDAYERGESDISWMAYRLYGDTSRRMAQERSQVSMFDQHEELNTKLFDFGILSVLLRAGKRRTLERRSRVSLKDLVAGLLRKGYLLRFLCKRSGIDPDSRYQDMLAESAPDAEHVGGSGEDSLPALCAIDDVSGRSIASRNGLDEGVLALLDGACCASTWDGPEGPRAITERMVVESLFVERGDNPQWIPEIAKYLPPALQVWLLLQSDVGTTVDDNGRLLLSGLSPEARKIVETAHEFAQQRGIPTIRTRLLLAAFLVQPNGFVVRACKAEGLAPDKLRLLLIASVEGEAPCSYTLSYDCCEEIVLPILTAAKLKSDAAGRPVIDERTLFQAFAERASAVLKASLLQLKQPVDLDRLAARDDATLGDPLAEDGDAAAPMIPSDRMESAVVADSTSTQREVQPSASLFEPTAWQLLVNAAEIARLQGWQVVRLPHLFAAMLGEGDGPAGPLLRAKGLTVVTALVQLLSLVPPQESRESAFASPAFSPNAGKVVMLAVELARTRDKGRASIEDLFEAFTKDGGGVVGRWLRGKRTKERE
jgi:hypothetical protein